MHNPTKREIADEQRYLAGQLGAGNIDRYEAARQRALRDAYQLVKRRYRGEYLIVSDPGLMRTLQSRNPEGFCDAGSILEDGPRKRSWVVRWQPWKGQRLLRRVR